MHTSEKFFLKWKDFKENINTAFVALRNDVEFTDITLVCEDGNQVEAHKIVLAASSPFFHNLLKKNRHANPLIYMRGLKFKDLVAIVDFLYYGEVDIYQGDLDAFLNVAEELDLKGLNSGEEDSGEELRVKEEASNHVDKETLIKAEQKSNANLQQPQNQPTNSESNANDHNSSKIMIGNGKFSGDLKDLDEKVKSMMDRGENMLKRSRGGMMKSYVCQICSKEGQWVNIRDHIEANHIDGILIPCNICNKTVSSRQALRCHKAKNCPNSSC